MIRLSAFRWVPPFAQGWVRDLRVRWALEEAGLPYETVLISGSDQSSESYLQWQPFGQVPAYRDDEVEMFESGAIVLHIAARAPALMPPDEAGRARVTTWVLAALNTIEPYARNLIDIDDAEEERRARAGAAVDRRLAGLAKWLEGKTYLEDRFTAGDLIMATVLRELGDSGVYARFPSLDEYYRNCIARPAFGRALEAQLEAFRGNEPHK
jgi:glutathione S-transferase